MPERQGEACPFSGHVIIIDDYTIPVECPICGSIRKTKTIDRQNAYRVPDTYPNHPRMVRKQPYHSKRKRWKLLHGTWSIF